MKISATTVLAGIMCLALASSVQADLCGELEPGVITPCNCGDTLVTDYVLTEDLIDCVDRGLIIGADNITLNGNGHIIDGMFENQSIGVYLDNVSGVTLVGCHVTEFDIGCVPHGCTDSMIASNLFQDNVDWGMYVYAGGANTVAYNWVTGSLIDGGIRATNTSSNNFYQNHVADVLPCVYQAYEDGTSANNTWDGNYWDDYDGSGSYPIPGPGDGVDNNPNRGDIDRDADIDIADAAAMATCLAGPEVTAPPAGVDPIDFVACDLEGDDNDVDLADWAEFQRLFGG